MEQMQKQNQMQNQKQKQNGGQPRTAKRPVKTFQDLEAWRKTHELVLAVYRSTRTFPPEERYGLAVEMRRTVISITANIADGFKRRGSRDKAHFYNYAESSLEELKAMLLVARDLGYRIEFDVLWRLAETAGRLLCGLHRSWSLPYPSASAPSVPSAPSAP